jgi:hypothetical protein
MEHAGGDPDFLDPAQSLIRIFIHMENNPNLFSLSVEPASRKVLLSIARWARFLAIIGMVIIVVGMVMMIMGTVIRTDFTHVDLSLRGENGEKIATGLRIGMLVSSVLFSVVAFFPLYYLLLFSSRMKRALRASSQEQFNLSFQHLKKYFRYLGIIAIVIFLLYAVSMTVSILWG